VTLKAAKWALVGPVLTTCGSQEGSLSEFSDSLGREILGSSHQASGSGIMPTVERDDPPGKGVGKESIGR
jgi:hypothetical protein